MWGASIPALRAQAGVSDGELGTALLFVGAGALPAMLLAGRLVDRWGGRATGSLLVVLAGAGVLVAGAAHDLLSLSAALAGLGAASGAADVAINSTAGSAQRATGRPVLSRAHATFSAGVVVASLLTGAGRALGALLVVPFAVLVPLAAAAAVAGGACSTSCR
jgi:MFS family permease